MTAREKARAKYNRSAKGKATQRRYNQSAKHKQAAIRWAKSKRGRQLLQQYRQRTRLAALRHYCRNENPYCMCIGCPITLVEILEIHHVKNNGARHRETIGGSGMFFLWLKQHGYPKGYKVLCPNCHRCRHRGVKCPHTAS